MPFQHSRCGGFARRCTPLSFVKMCEFCFYRCLVYNAFINMFNINYMYKTFKMITFNDCERCKTNANQEHINYSLLGALFFIVALINR